jgi:hypothetical protein
MGNRWAWADKRSRYGLTLRHQLLVGRYTQVEAKQLPTKNSSAMWMRICADWGKICDEGEVVQEPIKLRDRMPSISPKSRSYKGGNTGD